MSKVSLYWLTINCSPAETAPPRPGGSPHDLKGYLAHKKLQSPYRTTIGLWALAYCRVPRRKLFLMSEAPL